MKKSKIIGAALAAAMFATAAVGLVACDKDAGGVTGQYTVTFNVKADETVTPTSAKTVNGKLTSLPTATKTGDYTFKGWSLSASSDATITIAYEFKSNTPLYAVFTANQPSGGGNEGGNEGGNGGGNEGDNNNPGGSEVVASDYDLYVDGTLAANLLPGTTNDTIVHDYYVADVALTQGQVLTFKLKDVTIEKIWGDNGGGKIVAVTEATVTNSVTVSESGTYTVDIKQYADQAEKPTEWCAWVGVPTPDSGGDESGESVVQSVGASGVWLVGAGLSGGGWDKGVELTKSGDIWTVTVSVSKDGWLKIRNGGTSDGGGTSWVANADAGYTDYPGDGNFVVKQSGTYTFSFDGEKVTVTPAQ